MWAVSAALHIKAGRVEGLEPGTWRYDPEGHRLQLIQAGVSLPARLQLTSENRSIAEESAFAFFLVVEMAALGPLYGEDGERLALLEAGAMTQLLEQQAHELGLDTCQIGGMAPEELRAALRLSETQRVLHVILGGPRDPTPTPAAERQARLVERIRRLRPDQVRGLLAARKRAQEEE
jgi:SagB-type dehydrogenase family enzyme